MYLKTIFLTFLLTFFTQPLWADNTTPELRAVSSPSERVPHLGFSAGVGSPEGDLNSGGNYALEFGFQAYIPFAIAGEVAVADYTSDNNRLIRSSILLKGSYNFGGNIPIVRYSYVGVALGPVWEEEDNSSGMAVGFQPNIGFDYPLERYLDAPITLGTNLSYLTTSRGTADVFALNGVVKYWY